MNENEPMSGWTGKRKSVLVLDIIQGHTTIAQASHSYGLPLSEIEAWIQAAWHGMQSALRANRPDIPEQCEH